MWHCRAMDLLAWRAKHHHQQGPAARILGISQAYLCRLERGLRSPSAEIARRIVAATGGEVTADDLLRIAPAASSTAASPEGV